MNSVSLLRRVWVIMAIIGIIVPLALIFAANETQPISMHKEVIVLVEAPSLATLIDDSTAIHYLLAAGVKGIVLKPSTLGGILSGRDATMASGEEILRLFRMEGIVNIWMWEQIKDKPIRSDATYVFTNQLSLFESVLAALTQRLGAANVKPYRTKDHDFGGDIPGNYIIEVLAPMEELRSVAIGLDKSNRDRLSTTTLLPVIEIATSEDVKSLPRNTEAILVSSTAAAQAAFATLSPSSIFLSKGVANPGWRQAVTAFRSVELDSPPHAQAVIAPVTEVLRVISDLKSSGYAVSAPSASEVPAAEDKHFRKFGWAGSSGVWDIFGVGIILIYVITLAKNFHVLSLIDIMLQTALLLSMTLLAGELIAPGRAAPSPWISALAAMAVYAALCAELPDGRSGSSNYLLCGIALAATRMLPEDPLLLALALIPLGIFTIWTESSNDRLRTALQLFILPAVLTLLLNKDIPLGMRGLLAAWMLVGIIAPILKTRWARNARIGQAHS